jgi:hypothetical protein
MTAGLVVGVVILAGYALLVLGLNGRTRPGRSVSAVSYARWRACGWFVLAVAVLVAGWSAVGAGLLLFAALAVFVTVTVAAVRRRR